MKRQHIHFIGIAGINMSGLALTALEDGARVSGSDPSRNAATDRLEERGAKLYRQQVGSNIETERPDLVVVTAAIHEDNDELAAVRKAAIPVVSRADYLGRLMARHSGPKIAVAGTHGKTTTTAIAAEVLLAGNLDPTVFVGGEYGPIGGNVRIGGGSVFLTEACEAYVSFLSLHPDIVVITNVEADHLDHYGSEAAVFEGFRKFILGSDEGGVLVWCAEDDGARKLMDLLDGAGPERKIAVGFSPTEYDGIWADEIIQKDGGSSFAVWRRIEHIDERLGHVKLQVPGKHNILNGLAALGAGMAAGVSFDDAALGLSRFVGTQRRFEYRGDVNGVRVMDDYAHHPTEIRVTLKAAREAFSGRRLIVAFQPHLYSRTRDFMQQFAEALSGFDCILLTDIYPAREAPIPGVHVAELVKRVAELAPEKTVLHVPNKRDLPDRMRWISKPGDVLFTMGAGDIREEGERYLTGDY